MKLWSSPIDPTNSHEFLPLPSAELLTHRYKMIPTPRSCQSCTFFGSLCMENAHISPSLCKWLVNHRPRAFFTLSLWLSISLWFSLPCVFLSLSMSLSSPYLSSLYFYLYTHTLSLSSSSAGTTLTWSQEDCTGHWHWTLTLFHMLLCTSRLIFPAGFIDMDSKELS